RTTSTTQRPLLLPSETLPYELEYASAAARFTYRQRHCRSPPGMQYATCTPNHKVILLQVPRNRSRRGEPSHQSLGHMNDFTAACDLPAQGAGSGGTHHD